MRTIVAGSRTITSYSVVSRVIDDSGLSARITEVVCGMARGVDTLGKAWADQRGIPVKEFPVTDEDWLVTGKKAGHERNREMASYAMGMGEKGALILVWDGRSRGSRGMLNEAKLVGLTIFAPCLSCWGRSTNRRCLTCKGVGHYNVERALFSEEL